MTHACCSALRGFIPKADFTPAAPAAAAAPAAPGGPVEFKGEEKEAAGWSMIIFGGLDGAGKGGAAALALGG